jgi:uncharacterized membrane protein YhfC
MMVYIVFALNFGLMIAIPLLVGRWLAQKRQISWTLFGMGAVTFVASQIGHLYFNWLILQRWQLVPTDTAVLANLLILSLFVGLSAGVFEEVSRYLTFRYWAKNVRSWGTGLMLGAGHGGIEAILVALLGALGVGQLALIERGWFASAIPTEQWPMLQAIIAETFSAPWYLVLLGAAERLFAICAHLALSLMVMQVFVRGQKRWLLLAILWHALLDFTAVFAVTTWNPYITEGLIGILALASVGIIFWLRAPEPVEPELEPLPELAPLKRVQVEQTAEILERSKYS